MKRQLKFALRRGTSIGGVNADTIGGELERIQKRDGKLTAPGLVNESRPEDAALHPCFEWDDSIAAEAHREHQARNIIRSVVRIDPITKETAPVYVHVPSSNEKTEANYQPVAVVVEKPDLFVRALGELLATLRSAEKAVNDLQAAAGNRSDDERARLILAANALSTATAALGAIH